MGYEVVVLDANLDEQALSGPAWGTWELWSFTGDPLLAGTYTGYYEKGVETARSVGRGVGSNAGQRIQAEVIEAPAGGRESARSDPRAGPPRREAVR